MNDAHAVSALTALAHDDRLRAFRLLVTTGPEGLPSGEIAERLDVPPTRMSFHLATLERSGLLGATRRGRNIVYAVDYARIRALLMFLTEDCCGGHPQICGDLAALCSACETETGEPGKASVAAEEPA
ncbi:metalloregulator ArsR/SmtB family transcription factor [Breoghania sp. L-A4]|uniref:ArsR/SmtB family transcription factor n=1 Tax=Breoghania sp. L-A4 TaxID=2304600 RepID=UPI000E35D8CE|nr:metalloregulator ArsR/SmtB family transcription factor [Breoghania sp. L-A4]AXS41360.1 ArsR family transcriptional regulator [Breoghania sp. L-A4]